MVVVVALAIASFGIPLAVAAEHRQADQDRRELVQVAALAASRIEGNHLLATSIPHKLEVDQRLGLYDTKGELLDGRGPSRLEPAVRPVLDDRIVDVRIEGNLVVAVPVVDNSRITDIVRVAEPLAAGRSRILTSWLRLTILALAIILAAALAAVGLARRLTRPLADMGRDAERIGDGDFTIAARRTGIPEIDQVGAALTRTASRLSNLVAREQAFSADASHQLRSPLAALRVTLEGELTHPRADPVIALTEALTDVERLERTIEDLLALARDTGQERPPIEVADVFAQLGRRWTDTFAAARRTLAFDIPRRLPALRVSAAALQHILDVLVDNALRHAVGTVRVTARSSGGTVMIDIVDEGPGVEDPALVFERRHSARNGTGIGLALARRLAEAEGGRLSLVRAAPGATFQLAIPPDRTGDLLKEGREG